MTLLGKILVFLNLILGIGAAVYATSVYTQRPTWYLETIEGGIDKGNAPLTFKQMAADIDAKSKQAALASATWGANLKALTQAEALRTKRYQQMFGTDPDGTRTGGGKGLIDLAHEGGGPGGTGFYNLAEDSTTKLLDLTPDPKNLVKGPDNQPLKGTDTLLNQFTEDGKEAETQAFLSLKLRQEQKTLGAQIVVVQSQVLKQREIRDNLVSEAAHLASFEINATLNRETYRARQRQLLGRLLPFRESEKK
jgi:hypothetical protein